MTKKLRFGIVGCGVIGPFHAQAITSLPDAELVAVADIILERAQELAETFQVTPYSDFQEMLAREQLDVVDICTPSGLHRVQQETGMKMAVISQHRFDPDTVKVHELIEEQAFGRLVLGNALVPWWRSQTYYESGEWRGTWKLDGGGVLMNQSIHSIDLVQWLMGPVKSVIAYTDTLVHRMQTEDVAVAVLRFTNGALGTIAATTGAYPGTGTRVEIYGDKGSAVIEDDHLSYLHLARDDGEGVSPYGATREQRAPSSPGGPSAAQNPAALAIRSHALQIEDMMRAIRENGTPLVDGYAAKHPVEIILGIYESARTHKEVTLS